MRDIKFRAWFAQERKMIAPASIQQIAKCGCSSGFTDHCIFLQYTGLKDCNGVEVYEGDVIEDDEHYYSTVEWDEEDAMFTVKEFGSICDYNGVDIKVIGNIYENPELLENDK